MINKMHINRNFWAGKNVLITGHTGFKGSWLSLLLSECGANLSGISLSPDSRRLLFTELLINDRFQHELIADIRDLDAITGFVDLCSPDIVFHLAAQPLVRDSYRDPLKTWTTNVIGSLHILESLRSLDHRCGVVMVTTDKVYENQEWDYGYRETDRLGGKDPYSASKASSELAIQSWQYSFCGHDSHQHSHLSIATARAGNVIGGGDWALERIVPDLVNSLSKSQPLEVRNPNSVRPWQHVLDPLSGYIVLAESLYNNVSLHPEAFNFGPNIYGHLSVAELVNECMRHWNGTWISSEAPSGFHESNLLRLQTGKAWSKLRWKPTWDFPTTVERTMNWYRRHSAGISALSCCLDDLSSFFD